MIHIAHDYNTPSVNQYITLLYFSNFFLPAETKLFTNLMS